MYKCMYILWQAYEADRAKVRAKFMDEVPETAAKMEVTYKASCLSVYMCMHTYIRTYIHTYMHVYEKEHRNCRSVNFILVYI